MDRPKDLFDRVSEWREITDFVQASGAGLRIGVVYGRRRQGKSYLLRRLVAATGGAYIMPLEEEREPALRRFSDDISGHLGVPTGTIRFDNWEVAFRTALSTLAQKSGGSAIPPVLVVDELPYLLAHSPEIPSIIQRLYDESRDEPAAPMRVIACGSALSIMTDLLGGSRALRGRALMDLCLKPFGYREAADFWAAPDADSALRLQSVFGGTPGYRDLTGGSPPSDVDAFGTWLGRNVLNPAHALFSESDYLLREDPRLTDRALYHSVLTAIAGGANTPTQIGAAVGRPAQSLAHPLNVLQTAEFVHRIEDVLLQRKPSLILADPIVRFHQLITAPRLAELEEGHAAAVWRRAGHTFSSNILGPQFELMARKWVRSFGPEEGLHRTPGAIGPTVVNDSAGRTQHEVDVIALAEGQAAHCRDPIVTLLGEAKHSIRPRTIADVERLEHIRSTLVKRKVDAAHAQLVVFYRDAVDNELRRLAAKRSDLLLLSLRELYRR